MVSKLSAALVLMMTTTMLGGCAVWTRTPAHVSYDFSDRDFYDRTYAPSPSYVATSVYSGTEKDGAVDDQVASSHAKSTPQVDQGEGGAVDSAPVAAPRGVSGSVEGSTPVVAVTPAPTTAPVTRTPSAQRTPPVVVRQSTSPGSTRSGQISTSSSADR